MIHNIEFSKVKCFESPSVKGGLMVLDLKSKGGGSELFRIQGDLLSCRGLNFQGGLNSRGNVLCCIKEYIFFNDHTFEKLNFSQSALLKNVSISILKLVVFYDFQYGFNLIILETL